MKLVGSYAPPAPALHDVYLWMDSFVHLRPYYGMLASLLSAGERARAERFYFLRDRERFILGRGRLRLLLSEHIGEDGDRIEISYNSFGKPYIRSNEIFFNVAHSEDRLLIALSYRREVGVDVEHIRSELGIYDLGQRFFSSDEIALLEKSASDQRERKAFFCWAGKEALLKGIGCGLRCPLNSYSVLERADTFHAVIKAPVASGDVRRWSLASLDCGPDYAGAIAADLLT